MMSCNSIILSNDIYDFIVSSDELTPPLLQPLCIQPINELYAIWYYDRATLPPLSIREYSYSSIPKCFSLMDSTSLEVSGILAIQNQPNLALKGQGILIGIIDTGIAYTNPLFQDATGNTRIYSIWDQTATMDDVETVEENVQKSNMLGPPEGFIYGIEYTRDEIDRALQSDTPESIVPERDENGHGTYLASIAAGSEDVENDFIGAAPECELVVVKLKEAKQNIREFFYLSETEALYQENDIMAGVAYVEDIAKRTNRPVVILLGVGSNQGSHTGTGPLSTYLDFIGFRRGRTVVVPAGNEAISAHHFYGEANSSLSPLAVEINVEADVKGFCMELWSYSPELVRVVVQSPTGQRSQGGFPVSEETQVTNFVFENTVLTLDYRISGVDRDLLVFFRFTNPTEGIWTVLVYPQQSITGAFHMWLPIQPQVGADVTFISPNPDTTITTPGMAEIPITVGGYEGLTGARWTPSGRGFSGLGQVKPDFCAPSVAVFGAGRRNDYVTQTGSSMAAAITAGAAALCMEWGILDGYAPTMNSVEVKNLLIRGCQRDANLLYPNKEWGYGKLDLYRAFD
ncbi:MAG: S8 family peptidase, partial [Agathobacter sp.]|nr:S8 family peptidase [Agathobacter sp.]